MKGYFVIGFSILSMLSGVWAAAKWLSSTLAEDQIEKLFVGLPKDGPWPKDAFEKAAIKMTSILANHSNRKAAAWTAVSVVLSAVSNIIGAAWN